jgi:hypothetical protein
LKLPSIISPEYGTKKKISIAHQKTKVSGNESSLAYPHLNAIEFALNIAFQANF